ncbi:MAG: prealbumin-like fold domain-containing protein, partial [Anaerovoracaceae bacterium]
TSLEGQQTAITRVRDFGFIKADQNGAALGGPEFKLYSCTKLEEPGHTHSASTTSEESCWGNAVVATAADGTLAEVPKGQVLFTGLLMGEYRLVETNASPGYQLPRGQWKITLTAEGETIVLAEEQLQAPAFEKEGDVYKVRNYKSMELPIAGGEGNLLNVIAGIIIIGTAMLLMILNKKKRSL